MKQIFFVISIFGGCSLLAQSHIYATLQVNQPPELQAYAGEDILSSGIQTFIGGSPTAVGGTAPYTYIWSPQENLSDPTISNPAIIPTQEIEYTVTISDGKGCTDSDGIRIKISSTQILQNHGIVFFPNPANDIVTIRSEKNKDLIDRIQILDIAGRLIIDQRNLSFSNEFLIDVSMLCNGKYLIRIDFSGNKNYLPLIIER